MAMASKVSLSSGRVALRGGEGGKKCKTALLAFIICCSEHGGRRFHKDVREKKHQTGLSELLQPEPKSYNFFFAEKAKKSGVAGTFAAPAR